MTAQEYLDSWSREPLTGEDRKKIRMNMTASWIMSIIFPAFAAVFGYLILSLFFVHIVAAVILTAGLGAGVIFLHRFILKKTAGPFLIDRRGNEKIVFSAVLTKIGETEASKRESFNASREGTQHLTPDYFLQLNHVLELSCSSWEKERLSEKIGSRVKGAILPNSNLLLYILEEDSLVRQK